MLSIRLSIDHVPYRSNHDIVGENIYTESWALLSRPTLYKLIGINVILISGVIHLNNALNDHHQASYLEILFLAYFLGAMISAIGISWGGRLWGWVLGGLIASGAMISYLVSRIVGFSSAGVQEWGPPEAYLSMFIEMVFFVPFIAMYSVNLSRVATKLS
jgi:hypothetical protein